MVLSDESAFQASLYLVYLLSTDIMFVKVLLESEKQTDIFLILTTALTENIDHNSKSLIIKILCNITYKNKEAHKTFKKNKISEYIKEFLSESIRLLTID